MSPCYQLPQLHLDLAVKCVIFLSCLSSDSVSQSSHPTDSKQLFLIFSMLTASTQFNISVTNTLNGHPVQFEYVLPSASCKVSLKSHFFQEISLLELNCFASIASIIFSLLLQTPNDLFSLPFLFPYFV